MMIMVMHTSQLPQFEYKVTPLYKKTQSKTRIGQWTLLTTFGIMLFVGWADTVTSISINIGNSVP